MQNFLKDWLPIISAIAALGSAIAAFLSWRSAENSRKIAESLSQPYVLVHIKSSRANKNFIDLVITNTGSGIARNITFNVTGDDLEVSHNSHNASRLSQLGVFKKGIDALGPREERKYYILSLIGQYEEILKTNTEIKVAYQDAANTNLYSHTYKLDFYSLEESDWVSDEMKAPKEIADSLKQIARNIKSKL